MNELIRISNTTISNEEVQTINARDLHEFLEIGKDFSNWIKDRIDQYDFIEGQDFVLTFAKIGERKNVKITEYHLTLDMAKEISMVERNVKGKQARLYFIECEKRTQRKLQSEATVYKRKSSGKRGPSVMTTMRFHLEIAEKLTGKITGLTPEVLYARALKNINDSTGEDVNSYIADIPAIPLKELAHLTPTMIGRRFEPELSPKRINSILETMGFQVKEYESNNKDYHWVLTEAGTAYGEVHYIDANGTRFQLHWKEDVVEVISNYQLRQQVLDLE